LKRFPLRIKLAVFSSLLVLGVALSVGFSLYLAERHYLVRRVQHSQVEMVEVLSQIARETMSSRSELLLSSYLALVRRSRSLSYAVVMDTEGRVVAHSNVILVGQRPVDDATRAALSSEGLFRQSLKFPGDVIIDLSLPIYVEGRRAGTARVGYSQAATRLEVDQALQEARRRIAVATAAALFLGLIGAVIQAYLFSRPIRDLQDGARRLAGGELGHRLEVTTRDELGELAEEFNEMAAKLQELDQLKQDFVSNVTHELRSPMTSLRGYVDFLLRGDAGPLTEEQAENLIVVKNNAARLARFIDNLLDVAKIEARKVELHPEALALNGVGREMVVLFRPQAEEKEVRLVNEIPADLPPVWGDADKVAEIFTNLVSNAFKFTPAGGTVTLSAAPEADDLHVRVADTGVGIPAAALETVFNKFEQVKPTEGLVRKTKGTGLGLTIVRGFIEAHGGRVWIESELNKGTVVHFTLPKARAAAEPDAASAGVPSRLS
jgi:histidine kinase